MPTSVCVTARASAPKSTSDAALPTISPVARTTVFLPARRPARSLAAAPPSAKRDHLQHPANGAGAGGVERRAIQEPLADPHPEEDELQRLQEGVAHVDGAGGSPRGLAGRRAEWAAPGRAERLDHEIVRPALQADAEVEVGKHRVERVVRRGAAPNRVLPVDQARQAVAVEEAVLRPRVPMPE